MIKNVSLNLIKMQEWELPSECGGLISGLMLIALEKSAVYEKNEKLFYTVPRKMLLDKIPLFINQSNITKYLNILKDKNLIKLDIEKDNINFMFTDKGTTWLTYDLVSGKKCLEMPNV